MEPEVQTETHAFYETKIYTNTPEKSQRFWWIKWIPAKIRSMNLTSVSENESCHYYFKRLFSKRRKNSRLKTKYAHFEEYRMNIV